MTKMELVEAIICNGVTFGRKTKEQVARRFTKEELEQKFQWSQKIKKSLDK